MAPLLTPQQTKALDFIRRFAFENRYPPTAVDLAGHMGVGSTMAEYYFRKLEKKGFVRRAPGKVRTVVLTDKARRLPIVNYTNWV